MKETLRDLRVQSGKTVAEIAAALNVTSRSVIRYEQGSRCVSLQQVLDLANLYDCTAEELIEAQLNSCQKVQEDNRKIPCRVCKTL